MNPFTQLIGPLLLIHMVVLLKGKGKPTTPRARLRNKAAQWLSLVIVTVVAWIFCVIGMLVIAVSIADPYSNFHVLMIVLQGVRDWLSDGVGFAHGATGDMMFILLPIPVAALLTIVQQIRRKWGKVKE